MRAALTMMLVCSWAANAYAEAFEVDTDVGTSAFTQSECEQGMRAGAALSLDDARADDGALSLREAICLANHAGEPSLIALPALAVIRFDAVDNGWYGPNALPAIASAITLEGHGATLARADGAPAMRFAYVAGPFHDVRGAGAPTPGRLDALDLTLSGGLAAGGDSDASDSGAGAGLGGAMFNQGELSCTRCTFADNVARGGHGTRDGHGSGGLAAARSMAGRGLTGEHLDDQDADCDRYACADSTCDTCPGGAGGPGGLGGPGAEDGEAGRVGVTRERIPGAWFGGAGGTGGRGGAGAGFAASDGAGQGGLGGVGNFRDASGLCNAGGGGGGGGGGGLFQGGGFGSSAGGLASGYPCGRGGAGGGGGGGVGGPGASGVDALLIEAPSSAGAGGFGAGGGAGGLGYGFFLPGPGGRGGFGGGGGAGGGARAQAGLEGADGGFGGGRGGDGLNAEGVDPKHSAPGGGAGMGGAIFNHGGEVVVVATLFVANRAEGGAGEEPPDLLPSARSHGGDGLGGALFNLNGVVSIAQCTLAANEVVAGGGPLPGVDGGDAIYSLFLADGVGNSVLAANATSTVVRVVDAIVSPTNAFRCVGNIVRAGTVIGCGGTTSSPVFVKASQRDYHLSVSSSGLDEATDPTSAVPGARDRDGVPRGLDGDGDGVAKSDVGAFERLPPRAVVLLGPPAMSLEALTVFDDPGALALDSAQGVVQVAASEALDVTAVGTTTLVYAWTDSATAEVFASATRDVTVIDSVAPSVSVVGDDPLAWVQGVAFVDPGATAIDAVEGVLEVEVSGTVDVANVGSYVLTYAASDTSGNTASATRTVEVAADVAPDEDPEAEVVAESVVEAPPDEAVVEESVVADSEVVEDTPVEPGPEPVTEAGPESDTPSATDTADATGSADTTSGAETTHGDDGCHGGLGTSWLGLLALLARRTRVRLHGVARG